MTKATQDSRVRRAIQEIQEIQDLRDRQELQEHLRIRYGSTTVIQAHRPTSSTRLKLQATDIRSLLRISPTTR